MTAACSRGIYHNLSRNSTGEIYSIASIVLGNHEHGSMSTHALDLSYTHAHTLTREQAQPSLSESSRVQSLHVEKL